MGSKMGRGTERYCAAHVSVAFVLLRRFHSEEEGSTLHDSVAWRSYYPLFWYDVWFPPVSAPIVSLSGAAPWPFFFCLPGKDPAASDRTARHVCGIHGGKYLGRSAHMWMTCETKRG
ncbi:hypothetical protein TcCL_NonESM12025 [Trypanosoma cruzi]|nr:hypothetical protein TcCL_NonESM12025 [Trypanosoma cruzi]